MEGTLENADSPVMSPRSGAAPPALAFERTDVDRHAVTRSADPEPARAPRNGTEPIAPPEKEEHSGANRALQELEESAQEGSEGGAEPRATAGGARRDSTPPPVAQLSGARGSSVFRSGAARAPLLAVFGGAVALVIGGVAWSQRNNAHWADATAAPAPALENASIPAESAMAPTTPRTGDISQPATPVAAASTTAQPLTLPTGPRAAPRVVAQTPTPPAATARAETAGTAPVPPAPAVTASAPRALSEAVAITN